MPMKPPRLCPYPTCSVRLFDGEVCPTHGKKGGGIPSKGKNKDSSFRHGVSISTRAWMRLSEWIKRREPWCRVCKVEPTTETDHVLPRKFGGTHERRNLQGLCKSCHSMKTSREKRCKTKDQWIQRERTHGVGGIRVDSVKKKRNDVDDPFEFEH